VPRKEGQHSTSNSTIWSNSTTDGVLHALLAVRAGLRCLDSLGIIRTIRLQLL
jgi:hypothetical protein